MHPYTSFWMSPLAPARAASGITCTISTSNFTWLVRRRGWSLQQYETWLATTICDQLLPAPGAAELSPSGETDDAAPCDR